LKFSTQLQVLIRGLRQQDLRRYTCFALAAGDTAFCHHLLLQVHILVALRLLLDLLLVLEKEPEHFLAEQAAAPATVRPWAVAFMEAAAATAQPDQRARSLGAVAVRGAIQETGAMAAMQQPPLLRAPGAAEPEAPMFQVQPLFLAAV
jgi:hypothetical protein